MFQDPLERTLNVQEMEIERRSMTALAVLTKSPKRTSRWEARCKDEVVAMGPSWTVGRGALGLSGSPPPKSVIDLHAHHVAITT